MARKVENKEQRFPFSSLSSISWLVGRGTGSGSSWLVLSGSASRSAPSPGKEDRCRGLNDTDEVCRPQMLWG